MKKYLVAIIFFLIIFLLFKAGFGILFLLARFWYISIPIIAIFYYTKKTNISKDKKEKSDPNVIDAEFTVEDDDENLNEND